MDIKKLNPWNWFSREGERYSQPLAPQRHEPVTPGTALMQLHEDLDRTFSNMMRAFGMPVTALFEPGFGLEFLRPHIDVVSGDKEYVITVEVPGVSESDVKLELSSDGALVVSGEKRQETENRNRNIYRTERAYGAFRRILSLPDDADRDHIDACFRNGVLIITCPRTDIVDENVRQIEIKKAA